MKLRSKVLNEIFMWDEVKLKQDTKPEECDTQTYKSAKAKNAKLSKHVIVELTKPF